MRESTKYEHVVAFADALPAIREIVEEHMGLRGLPREKVLATVVHLLETTLIRVGNDDYAKQNSSYGLTTLKNRHVAVDGNEVRFRFTGKSGKHWSLRVKDRRVAKIIKACQDLPGQELLQYMDEAGNRQDVTSTDVNEYLKEITGKEITAKDFRTWAGTVLAAMALSELESFDSAAQAKRNLRAAIEKVASRLGNTPTICRKCYVHPEVLNSYMDGNLVLELKSQAESELRNTVQRLKPEEAAVLALLRGRLEKRRNVQHRRKDRKRRLHDFNFRFALLVVFCESFRGVLDGLYRHLGALPAEIFNFLSSSSSVAMKNFSSSSCIGLVRSRTSSKARSECERRGTANRRSFRSDLLLLFCSIWRIPMTRQVMTRPGNVAASWITMMSSGSPSSALVEGTKPQS